MDINAATKELENALSTTREFTNVSRAYELIKQKPKALELMKKFEKKQEALYSDKLSESQVQYLIDELNNDYNKLNSIPEINKYLNAIDSFNEILGNITKEINTSLFNRIKQ